MLPIDYRLLKSGNQLLLSNVFNVLLCTLYNVLTTAFPFTWSPMIHLKMVISHLLHAWCCARNRDM